MDPNSQQYMDLYAYVASLTPAVKKEMLRWEKERQALMKKIMSKGGGGKGNPCNPCAAKGNPCNPCAAKKANPCNPCAAKKNPCNPCAAKKANPCNPCAGKK